ATRARSALPRPALPDFVDDPETTNPRKEKGMETNDGVIGNDPSVSEITDTVLEEIALNLRDLVETYEVCPQFISQLLEVMTAMRIDALESTGVEVDDASPRHPEIGEFLVGLASECSFQAQR
ncbi:MAG: hypothetical protein K8E66_09585, partial [Phycisphaerales bacterium]|nr:hypothetical protein [Phycisphaerales bacterium]